jgi:PTS HPr component phosphorylation site
MLSSMAFIPSCVRPPKCHIVLCADRPTIIISNRCWRSVLTIGAFVLLAESAFQAAALNRTRKEVEIINKLGLHARPAAQFVDA